MSMLALTFWRPWPSIIQGPTGPNPERIPQKLLENRGWPLPAWAIGVDVAMHAGLTTDRESLAMMVRAGYLLPDTPQPTGVVGVFQFTACVPPLRVRQFCPPGQADWWWMGNLERPSGGDPHAWMMDRARSLATPVPCKGAQGFWRLPPEVEALVRAQLGEVAGGE